MYFNWENICGVNSYKLIIAKDNGFRDVVYEKETIHNYDVAELSLEAGKYYWKVEAKNTSREFGFNSVSDIRTFTIGENYKLTDVVHGVYGNKRTISAKLTYNGDMDKASDCVYIAVYDADNRLKGVSMKDYSFTKGVSRDIECELAVNPDDMYIKVFVWSLENTARMLSKTFVITD